MERQERAGTAVTRRADPARGSWRAGRLGASRTAAEESGLTQYQQPLADRMESPGEAPGHISLHAGVAAERAARASLRTQIARLENELSQIVVDRFPFIPLPSAGVEAAGRGAPAFPTWASSSAPATASPVACRICGGWPAPAPRPRPGRGSSFNGCGWNRVATSSCDCPSAIWARADAGSGRSDPASA